MYKTDGRHGFVIVTIRIDHLSVSRNLLLRLLFVPSSQSFLFQTVDEAFDVGLYPFIRLRLTIPRVLPEHLLNGGHGMLIGRQFILHLNGMLGQVAYLPFAVAPQCFANARKHRRNDTIEEVVAAHIEISGLRCQSQRKQTLHERLISVASLRENLLQTTDFRIYAVAQRLQRLFGMVEIEAFDENDVEKSSMENVE